MLAALDKVQTSLTLFSFAQHLAVEIRSEPLLASKSLVDEQVLFVLSHGVAKIYILHTPAVAFKLMHNYPMKILVVHRIVRAKSSSIIVIDDTVVGMGRIVGAEVCNERRDFALKFWISRRMQWTSSHKDEILHRNFIVCLMISSH